MPSSGVYDKYNRVHDVTGRYFDDAWSDRRSHYGKRQRQSATFNSTTASATNYDSATAISGERFIFIDRQLKQWESRAAACVAYFAATAAESPSDAAAGSVDLSSTDSYLLGLLWNLLFADLRQTDSGTS